LFVAALKILDRLIVTAGDDIIFHFPLFLAPDKRGNLKSASPRMKKGALCFQVCYIVILK